jgi:GNAT superfamily N-acetyltransferase
LVDLSPVVVLRHGVLRRRGAQKERYDGDAIELVAEKDGAIIGLLDLECESDGLSPRPGTGGMIWHLATHPDHQRQGVASALLAEAERQAQERGLVRLEAWTRDDAPTRRWYERHGFVQVDYLHVYLERDDLRAFDDELRLVKALAHYTATAVMRFESGSRGCMTTSSTRNGCDSACPSR